MTDQKKTLRLTKLPVLLLLANAVAFLIVAMWMLLLTPAHAACACPPYIRDCNNERYCAGDMDHLGPYSIFFPYIIMGDTGGLVSFYVARYKRLEDRYIVIDGECNSACTLVLGNAKVCSTDKGMFGFHAASTAEGTALPHEKLPTEGQRLDYLARGPDPQRLLHPRPAIPAEVLMKIFDNVLTEPERKEEVARYTKAADQARLARNAMNRSHLGSKAEAATGQFAA